MAKKVNPENARRYGGILLAITRAKLWSHYTVTGSRKKQLLDFAIGNDGKRFDLGK
jgi:hypothetical protein